MSPLASDTDNWITGAQYPVTSLGDILEIVPSLHKRVLAVGRDTADDFTWHVWENTFPYGIWFRGEAAHPTPLTPDVFRTDSDHGPLDEAFVMNHLQTRISELYAMSNPFQKLCLAAHYGVPTRLLDWTESLLVAAYFAVTSSNPRADSMEGHLYVLNAYTLNNISGVGHGRAYINTADDFGTLFRSELAFAQDARLWGLRVLGKYPEFRWEELKGQAVDAVLPDWRDLKPESRCEAVANGAALPLYRSPVAVLPQRERHRMIVQSSTFVLFGGGSWIRCPENQRWQGIPERHADGRPVYLTFTIPPDIKNSICQELQHLGIHEGTLFPEMERQRLTLIRMGHQGTRRDPANA